MNYLFGFIFVSAILGTLLSSVNAETVKENNRQIKNKAENVGNVRQKTP